VRGHQRTPADRVLEVEQRGARVDRLAEHALEVLLLVRVVVLAHDRVQPVRMLDARHRVGHLLARGGDGDDLLHGRLEPAAVVVLVRVRVRVRV